MYMDMIYNISFAILTILALALFVISIFAYRRSRNNKILMVSMAFLLFFLKGLWLTYSLFTYPKGGWGVFLAPVAVLDCMILILLYLSLLKG